MYINARMVLFMNKEETGEMKKIGILMLTLLLVSSAGSYALPRSADNYKIVDVVASATKKSTSSVTTRKSESDKAAQEAARKQTQDKLLKDIEAINVDYEKMQSEKQKIEDFIGRIEGYIASELQKENPNEAIMKTAADMIGRYREKAEAVKLNIEANDVQALEIKAEVLAFIESSGDEETMTLFQSALEQIEWRIQAQEDHMNNQEGQDNMETPPLDKGSSDTGQENSYQGDDRYDGDNKTHDDYYDDNKDDHDYDDDDHDYDDDDHDYDDDDDHDDDRDDD